MEQGQGSVVTAEQGLRPVGYRRLGEQQDSGVFLVGGGRGAGRQEPQELRRCGRPHAAEDAE